MPKNITLSIPDELASEMDKYKEVNWSAVARSAIEIYIKHRQKPELAPVLDRFSKEKDELYAAGWNKAHQLVAKLSYRELEVIFENLEYRANLQLQLKKRNPGGIFNSQEIESPAFMDGVVGAFKEIKSKI
jgi:hypothetical protein